MSIDQVQLREQARQALTDGQWLFVARLSMPTWRAESGEVKDWSLLLQAVEQEGWYVDRLNTNTDAKNRPELIVMFRRRPPS